jgi:hypothetical protein
VQLYRSPTVKMQSLPLRAALIIRRRGRQSVSATAAIEDPGVRSRRRQVGHILSKKEQEQQIKILGVAE